jgi:hypothetical protein
MGEPVFDEPLQIERTPGEPPEIGLVNLSHEGVEVGGVLALSKEANASYIQRRHNHDEWSLGGRWGLVAPFFANDADEEFVGLRGRRRGLILWDRKLFVETGQIAPELPVGVPARDDDVGSVFSAGDTLGDLLKGAFKTDTVKLGFVYWIEEERGWLIWGQPGRQTRAVLMPERAGQAMFADILYLGVKWEAVLGGLPKGLGF